MDVKELLKKVRKIEIKSKEIVNTLFLGEYHSAFKGKGMEFSEVREYQFGDDIRSIDWNVTSRMNAPFVKVNHEERELVVFLIVDLSKSLKFGTGSVSKLELIAEIAAVFAFSAISNNDKVGMIVFADQVYKYIKPEKGRKQVLKIIRAIIDFDPNSSTGTNIEDALIFFNQIQKRKAIAILFSDFYDSHFSDAFKHTARKHQLIPVLIRDPFEFSMKKMPFLIMKDLESGNKVISRPGKRNWLKSYQDRFEKKSRDLFSMFRESKVKPIVIDIDQPYLPSLVSYFKVKT